MITQRQAKSKQNVAPDDRAPRSTRDRFAAGDSDDDDDTRLRDAEGRGLCVKSNQNDDERRTV